MARRLIGTATTNSQGIATIEYTGTGAGKLQLVAESGSLQSGVYDLLDCTVLDRGKSGTSGTDYVNLFTSMDGITRGTEDTHVYIDRSSLSSAANRSTAQYSINTGVCIEITLTEITTINQLCVTPYAGSTAGSRRAVNPTTTTSKVKFEITPTSIKTYLDDVLSETFVESGLTSFVFQIRTAGNTIDDFKYKNLAIYPI